ncbi:MAG: DEDD Tnp IS110 protein [Dehalococcoidia bacterium]|nr:DEDD Tnp IS110 protein [Dehalococcoidia bacterium]
MKNITASKLKQISERYLIVGVDTHKKKYAVVLRTQDAVVHSRFQVGNSRQGFDELLERTRVYDQGMGLGCHVRWDLCNDFAIPKHG